MPTNVFYDMFFCEYNKINVTDISEDEVDKFIKAKSAYNLNIIKTCIVICTILLVVLIIISNL